MKRIENEKNCNTITAQIRQNDIFNDGKFIIKKYVVYYIENVCKKDWCKIYIKNVLDCNQIEIDIIYSNKVFADRDIQLKHKK